MPRFSIWSIRIALVYLALGFTFGALMLANKGIPYAPAVWKLLPLHIEFLLFGWTWQLAMGVAFWILPRLNRDSPRGRETMAWISLMLLNGGIWLAGLGPLAGSQTNGIIFSGRLLETASVVIYVTASWKRVRSFQG